MNSTLRNNFATTDGTLGLAPIECGWDNPNCLGGYSDLLSARDAATEPMRSRWFYTIAPAMQSIPAAGNQAISDSSPTVTTPTHDPVANRGAAATSPTVTTAGVSIDRNVIVGGIVIAAALMLLKGDKTNG